MVLFDLLTYDCGSLFEIQLFSKFLFETEIRLFLKVHYHTIY